MNETGEVPLTPQETGEPPQLKRLEDMEEFKQLAPEQQERLLALRERLQNEAMNPRDVVTRSIDEMGFWEGLYHTAKPHLEKKRKIAVGKLKAYGSVAFSLIPVLGEGLSFGKGLFGLYETKKGIRAFVPAVRLKKAGEAVRPAMSAVREAAVVRKAIPLAQDAKFFARVGRYIGNAAEWTTRPFRYVFEGAAAPIKILNKEYAKHTGKVAVNMIGSNGAKEIYDMREKAQQSARMAQETFVAKKMAEAKQTGKDLTSIQWWDLRNKWQRASINRGGRAEATRVIRQANRGIDMMLESNKMGSGAGMIATEAYKIKEKAKPKVLENLGLKKYLAFFDQWFNLTPDVPHWLSTTTGLAEFVGVHGIDAIPGLIQSSILWFRDKGVDARLAKDVYGYTKNRLFGVKPERKAAAEVFPTSSGEAGLRGASAV